MSRARLLSAAVCLGAAAFLAVRIIPDVHGKPLFEDEAVTGLISVHGFGRVVRTVMWERGGAPLHFTLAHLVLGVEPTTAALRWLSVVLALATVPVTFDLGRRVGDRSVGMLAAVLCASSGLLAVLGTFGRMYALYALAGAIACDLFVRAVQQPSASSAALAAAGAWLLPATHPYGGIAVVIEAVVALVLWRGRPLRPALPAIAITLSMAVFAIADLRLALRFHAGAHGARTVASPHDAWAQLSSAIRGFAGGGGITALLLAAIGLVGLVVCLRTLPALAAVGAGWLLAPPLLALLVRAPGVPTVKTEPRHLIAGLAVWSVLVALGAQRLATSAAQRLEAQRRPRAAALALAVVAAVALASPVEARDIRTDVVFWARVGSSGSLHAPASWLRQRIAPGDLLYPYSAAYLPSLRDARQSVSLPRGQSGPLLDALEDARDSIPAILVAIPLDGSRVDTAALQSRAGAGAMVAAFPDWLVMSLPGPFAGSRAVVCRLSSVLAAAHRTIMPTQAARHEVGLYFSVDDAALADARASLHLRC